MNASSGTSHSQVIRYVLAGSNPKRGPNHDDARAPGAGDPLVAGFHQLRSNAAALMVRQHCHGPERRSNEASDLQRTVHDVTDYSALLYRHER